MLLPVLYHWAPSDRYDMIDKQGLVAGSKPTVSSEAVTSVSLSADPQTAWSLSGAMEWCSDVDQWDLWMVRLAEHDEVQVRAEFGPRIQEVKVRNSIGRDRVWFVGRRAFSGVQGGPQDVASVSLP